MRLLLLLILAGLVAGCAADLPDRDAPRLGIVGRELPRYGLNLRQSRCVGERLAATLTAEQLRQFERAAAAVTVGHFEPDRLTIRDLLRVAAGMSDEQVRIELARAAASCDATADLIPRSAQPRGAPLTSPRPAVWLNLGAAPTGQAIAVDAGSVERNGTSGRAWFRLTDPGAPAASGTAYLLRIDCPARTIAATARRTHDATGAVTEQRDYGPEDSRPGPVEGGTVMEIAYLSMCT